MIFSEDLVDSRKLTYETLSHFRGWSLTLTTSVGA